MSNKKKPAQTINKRKELWEVGAELRKKYSTEMCLANNLERLRCNGKIINSHTIPRSGSLKKIAESGHVYTYVHNDLSHIDKNQGRLTPKLVGIMSASTFKGFCSYHDAELFAPIERCHFTFTEEQCFLLFYRAYAKEVYNKKVQIENKHQFDDLIETNVPSLLQDKFKESIKDYFQGMATAIDDIQKLKPIMDDILEKKDYSRIKALILEFKDPLPYMLSGTFYPLQNFEGKKIQYFNNPNFNQQASLGCTSFSSNGKGYFVFTWLNIENNPVDSFIESFLNIADTEKHTRLLKMTFNQFENICMSPNWWNDELLSKETSYLNMLINRGINPNLAYPSNYLKDDGFPILSDRTIEQIIKVNF